MLRRLMICLAFSFPLCVHAADHFTVPLMVIRFNQPRVYYEQPLFNAMNRALQAKPDVRFQIIDYFPPQTNLRQQAERDFQRVLKTISAMGMPTGRLNIHREAAPDLNYSEVHIYVR